MAENMYEVYADSGLKKHRTSMTFVLLCAAGAGIAGIIYGLSLA